MKSLFYTLCLIIFSAIILKPLRPRPYPPPEVVEQRTEILFKEIELDNLVREIEHQIMIDSVQISKIKQND